ncbi:MAG: tRNA (adenosine(37)-N6)-threonylcarbamoyltransferase complex transferase subunit TsaD [Candidatus Nomurabacteria bacterium]|nr:tRNA (adenosine(37)-N6)-threonylcarbamoyltransferase complex transferase subunit TsaD [Candidatus Nomurabacteria bacterium]
MKVLGIETSCDETAAAVVENGTRLISNVVNSQIDIHARYGGVVPEVAARSHIEVVNAVIDEAVVQAGGWSAIDAIAVTYAPGLIGSLLVGTLAARTLAITKNKPLYPVHHIESHIYANWLSDEEDAPRSFPILALVVSGGHTQLILLHDHGDFETIGTTRDDAVGEVFDKVAKIIGLPYPGGPSISQAALKGDQNRYKLPKAKLDTPYDFSFSGLKTAVLRAVQAEVGKRFTFPSAGLPELLNGAQRADFAASFEKTAVDTLVDKLLKAQEAYQPKTVVVAGGVSANRYLRQQVKERLPILAHFPAPEFCTDNGAMVASAGYFHAQRLEPTNPYDLEVTPSLKIR